ncbi:MAG: DUF2461 domain-containing protein [Pseudomonadota bacterium]
MSDFSGFPIETIKFISGLSQNNSKDWFEAHRADYDAHYIGPAKQFVAAMAEPLSKLHAGLVAEPRVNGSIFRINRDIRFSKDKTPYKDHLDLWFWEGNRKGAISGLFFRIAKDQLILGAGAHGFDKDRLARFRNAVANTGQGDDLLALETSLSSQGLEMKGAHYSKLPRGFQPSGTETDRLLKFNALHAAWHLDHPAEMSTSAFIDYCIEKWKPLIPLHKWLVEMDEA